MLDTNNNTIEVAAGQESKKEKWEAAAIEEALTAIVAAENSGQLTRLRVHENIERLYEESGWTSARERKLIDGALAGLRKPPRQPQPVLAPDHSEEAVAAAAKLAQTPDIFAEFRRDLEAIGFPVQADFADSVLMALTSRLLPVSTGHIFYGESSSGKSAVVQAAFQMLPPSTVRTITSASAQAFYYMGDTIKNKVLAFGELKPLKPGEDDDMQRSARQLLSENRIVRQIVVDGEGVDRATEGPCTFTASTTNEPQEFCDELVNRCYWVPSDASAETTGHVLDSMANAAINPHNKQKDNDAIIAKWRAYNDSLAPLLVAIPYAALIKPTQLKNPAVRRLFQLLLNYIRCGELLHQSNRQRQFIGDVEAVVASPADYAPAFALLLRNAPRTLESVSTKAVEAYEVLKATFPTPLQFTAKEAAKCLGKHDSTVQRWLKQLREGGHLDVVETKYSESKANKYTIVDIAKTERQELGLVAPEALAEKLTPASQRETEKKPADPQQDGITASHIEMVASEKVGSRPY